jgi:hypothetical protein
MKDTEAQPQTTVRDAALKTARAKYVTEHYLSATEPSAVSTWNPIWPWQYTTGKAWTITCGKCQHSWREKLPVTGRLSARCPECRTRNVWEVEIG